MGPARPVPASILFKFLLGFLLFIELVSASLLGMAMGTAAEPLQVLREAIEGLDLAAHGDAIAEARELIDRLEARVALAEAEYSASGQAEVDGYPNMAAFLRAPGAGRRCPSHGGSLDERSGSTAVARSRATRGARVGSPAPRST